MAPVKRKAVTDERPSKKAKAGDAKGAVKEDGEGRKEKRPRKSQDRAEVGEKRAPSKSILQQEERAFPRGGGSVLTPIERKQIEAQAERDVLFEQETGQKAKTDNDDIELFDDTEAAPAKKKRKTGKKNDGMPKVEGSGVKISGLNYKSLVVGSGVLGRVTAITGRDVALALPNNLTGYVPITAVSERLNARIERMLADDAQGGADASGDDDEDVDLKKLFHPGQWLRAIVTSTGTDPAEGKSKRHIELSLDPSSVNGNLPEDNMVVNSTIQAAVRSVEDHGIVMDLGLADDSVKGFVSKKELGVSYSLDQIQEGQVILCIVTGKASNGKVLKLSPDPSRMSLAIGDKKLPTVSIAPSVDAFLPGTAADILIIESGARGLVGKIMGMVDVTADVIHSAGIAVEDMTKKYKVGNRLAARIIFSIPKDDGARRVGVSVLGHTLALVPTPSKLPEVATRSLKQQAAELDQLLPTSSTIDTAKVTQVSPDKGLFFAFSAKSGRDEISATAFAHISQIADKRIDTLSTTSGPYVPESTHKVRILSYNPVDNVYYVSLKPSVLEQAFLRLEDFTVGDVVKGTVDKMILGGARGVTGVLVKLSDNVTGLVPEMHLSDVQLTHPERKFKEGFPIKARILSVDVEKRHVRLTLKKTLVESSSEDLVWKDYHQLKPGMEGKGTIINLLHNGAVVQFFSAVRAWLPVAEMSETFIQKPEQHFRLGQTVNVRIVSVNADSQEMKVSCKESTDLDEKQEAAWNAVEGGHLVSATVTETTGDGVSVDLEGGLKGHIRIAQLTDSSAGKAESALKRLRVGQTLSNLLILEKHDRSRIVMLSNKSSLVEDAKAGNIISSFADVQTGMKTHGFVRNITPEGVFVEFTNGMVGLLPKSQLSSDAAGQPSFGLRKDQTLKLWVTDVDAVRQRFLLTTREQAAEASKETRALSATNETVSKPIDASIKSMSDFVPGKITKARIASIRATQINVRLADNVQGRVDVSEVFDSWDDISNKAAPLQSFAQNDIIDVKILGIHDARNHRFLPISHRQGKVPVFELSAKKSRFGTKGAESLLSLESVKPGSTHLAFVNNHGDNCVWVNLSPNVRGRIALMDLSDDVGQLQNVENRFRVGCALRVKVKAVDVASGKLDLSARQSEGSATLNIKDLSTGMVLPARVIKSSERAVSVQIANNIVCHVPLVELADDYEQVNPAQYNKNDIVRACVVGVDAPNKRAFVSLRPSKVLSSSLPIKDPQVASVSQLKSGEIVRGFVKKVADKGVFVSLGADIDALVRIADLSDQYVKDWRSIYEVDELVQGRVLSVDPASKQVQVSLKQSHVGGHYEPPLSINDLKTGMTVTGKVRKVEDFGAFIDIDNTQPRLSGLCHRSEVAAKRIEDVRKLYSAGDVVKAKVLSIDVESRKISLGLKASYFSEQADVEASDEESEDEDVEMDGGADVDEDDDSEGGIDVDLGDVQDMDSDQENGGEADEMDVDDDERTSKTAGGLKTNGFDWTGDAFDDANGAAYESEPETGATKKRKNKKPQIKEDLTGDRDKHGPQSNSDFERHLLGQPNNSQLWIQYMAFQLQLGEIQKAREIAERALRTIHIRETEEKLEIWLAWLNLEAEYGDEERVEEVFKQARQVQDPLEMHERLAGIYIKSGKNDKADAIYERIVANKSFRASPDVWLNYASFLMNTLQQPDRARKLLTRALHSVPTHDHRLLTAKFAALEFHSKASGDPERGRTIFEGIMSEWPKWSSGWDMWVDLERSRISVVDGKEAKEEARVETRALFERLSKEKMKKRRAKFVFKKWLEFEEKEGKEKDVERVKVLAREYVERMASRGGGDEED